MGDFTMLRKELLAGFVVAGFVSVHVPSAWWSHFFLTGHGALTVLENAVVAPLLAVVSFVCSVGNIPLAAALWAHGVAFGGVISFIFADLVTLPLLLIYRRFYGTRSMLRLFSLLWLVMSARRPAGRPALQCVGTDPDQPPLAGAQRTVPSRRDTGAQCASQRSARWCLDHARDSDRDEPRAPAIRSAGWRSTPVAPVATRVKRRRDLLLLLAALRRAIRPRRGSRESHARGPAGDHVDPVCSMRVNSSHASAMRRRRRCDLLFLQRRMSNGIPHGLEQPPGSQRIELGRKPSHE